MISLPNQLELQTLFSGFLFETGLSAVSVKNYLSDLRHFFSFCASITSQDNPPTVQEIFQSISKYLSLYLTEQKKGFTPQNTINRRSASIRRFSTFLSVKFGLVSDLQEPVQSSKVTNSTQNLLRNDDENSLPTISKILEHFRSFLVKEKKTHSTVKNYISDLNHFFAWSANETPFLDQNLENILSESHLNTYITYLRLSHTSTSVINRRQSSVKQFTRYCFLQKYIPTNPFEYKHEVPRLLPLSWFNRFSSSKNKAPKNGSKSRLGIWYQKYNSLPFTPYLHLAILVLATSAMVIFGYNQIIKQAAPSSAALPTVPRRQLSFQGRLTDSSGTPITTSVNVTFKLWNHPTAGTQLYSSNTCAITADPNGIFNTLIGDGVCGAEIANTVFTENRDVYLEVSIGSETLHPRQQIATVGYALNSETLQGYPASASATINTVPIIDNNGDINIAATSPSINSTSGTFNLNGQALTLTTTANSGGDIVLQPDAIGGGQIQMLGGTTNTDFLRIENANLTSGSLISGYVGNDTATGRLLSLTAGSTETNRFYVSVNGQTMINTSGTLANAGLIVNQNGSGDLFTASASGVTKFTIGNNGNITATGSLSGLSGLTVSSGTVTFPNGEINNAEISELDWTKLQNYPTACPAGQVVQAVGDTLSCVAMTTQLWQRDSGSLSPINITDALNLGATATSSALVHFTGTAGENSWINTGTGNFGIGITNPTAKLDIAGDASTSGSLVFRGTNPSTIDILNGNRLDFQTSSGGDVGLTPKISLLNNGNLGLGEINPTYKLVVNSLSDSSVANFKSTNSNSYLWMENSTGGIALMASGSTFSIGNDSLQEKLSVDVGSGNVGIGITNPTYKLDVVGDINLTGAFRSNGSAGTPGQILSTTGTGVSWIDAPTGGGGNSSPWNWTAGVTYPFSITDAVNLGNAATASATVHLAGTAGDNSFINTGNFGIGLTNPTSKLYISASSGNLFTINDTVNDILNITSAQTTFYNPTSFVSSGNVSIAYNLDFTNAVLSSITSAAPLFIRSGEIFNSSDLTLQTYNKGNIIANTEAFVINGSATVSAQLAVNEINLSGALLDNGSAGTPGQILSTTGTGVSWIDAPTGGGGNSSPWNWTAGVTYPFSITDAVNLGNAATASATVHLAGTAGDNSFINTGNFGIGLTNPAYKLDVAGNINVTGSYLVNGAPLTASNWQRTAGSLAPLNITDSVNIGSTATASANVHLAGTAGENSFINNGNFGIGDTTPASALTVGTGDAFQVNSSGAITAAKSITNTGAINQTGGVVSLNDSSNYNTTINTGTSTGSVSIGGNANTVAVNSSNWDISSSGAASGLTGISSSGNINFSTLTASRAVFTDASKNLVSTATSQYLVDSISDETGSGSLVFGTSPTFTTDIKTPMVTGGIANNSSLQLKSTSGAGTTDFISLNVGNNGGTEALRVISNGYVGIGTTTPSQMLQVGTGTGFLVNNNGAIMNANGATISGSVRFSSLGTGIIHADASGYLSSSALNLATEVTGILPIANGGTNNDNVTSPFVSGKFVAYDGTRLSSTSYDVSSFETALTFSNGLTRTLSNVTLGGALTGNTTIDTGSVTPYNMTFSGLGNFGIGVATPSRKLDVGGFFVVNTDNSRVGIGTTDPQAKLEIAGSTSTISNTSGDITFNAASDLLDFSGDSLKNFLNATANGQIQLGNFADTGRPTSIGTGSLIYSTTQENPQYYNGTSWTNLTNYFNRTAEGIIYPNREWFDSINLGYGSGGAGASSSATVRLSGDASNSSFFVNPVAFGFRTDTPLTNRINQPFVGHTFAIQTNGGILPRQTGIDSLGYKGFEWSELNLTNNIVKNGSAIITLNDRSLVGDVWHSPSGFKVGTGALTPMTPAIKFEVTGDAYISGTLKTDGQVTVGGGTGKMDVGVVDPPYTINGLKYATYMSSMVGMKEETVGKVTTSEQIEGLGYRTLIDLDQQPVGSDVWLFSKTTNIKNNISNLSVLLTPEGQAKAWYEIDEPNKILAIYSSTPANVTYRLTAPRFDSATYTNTRTSSSPGYIITSANNNTNTDSIFDRQVVPPELIANVDGSYLLKINNVENKEVASFFKGIIANLTAGAATITDLVATNLTVHTKLISPLADIDQLKTIDATVSGTLYANNIKGQTVDKLTSEINLLNEKYSTASAILTDLQARYSTYASLFGANANTLATSDPLATSSLDGTTPNIPPDLALNSLNVNTLVAKDLLANNSVFTKSISAFDTDLFIQPVKDGHSVHLLADLMTLYPDGKVRINGDLIVTGNVIAKSLDSEIATVSGNIAVGSSSISTESAKFAQLTTEGLVIASGNDTLPGSTGTNSNSNATIGEATIATGSTQINILNNKVTPSTLIYITPTSDTAGRVLFVKSKTEGVGFTVGITGDTLTPMTSFNYWLVETK